MLLGLSSDSQGESVDFSAITDGGDNGVPHGDLLVRFSQVAASLDSTESELAAVRAEVIDAMGEVGFVEAAATVANFTMMTRIADVQVAHYSQLEMHGTGTPLDPGTVEPSAPMREAMKLDGLVSARH